MFLGTLTSYTLVYFGDGISLIADVLLWMTENILLSKFIFSTKSSYSGYDVYKWDLSYQSSHHIFAAFIHLCANLYLGREELVSSWFFSKKWTSQILNCHNTNSVTCTFFSVSYTLQRYAVFPRCIALTFSNKTTRALWFCWLQVQQMCRMMDRSACGQELMEKTERDRKAHKRNKELVITEITAITVWSQTAQ